eukprot:GHVS01069110.1.p1 GENE.GHVS01069110.1~~GHVS01069110.1.p1  ORF type:complete len:330 (-),score=41.93 GHVS01069110.1:64-1053(-)
MMSGLLVTVSSLLAVLPILILTKFVHLPVLPLLLQAGFYQPSHHPSVDELSKALTSYYLSIDEGSISVVGSLFSARAVQHMRYDVRGQAAYISDLNSKDEVTEEMSIWFNRRGKQQEKIAHEILSYQFPMAVTTGSTQTEATGRLTFSQYWLFESLGSNEFKVVRTVIVASPVGHRNRWSMAEVDGFLTKFFESLDLLDKEIAAAQFVPDGELEVFHHLLNGTTAHSRHRGQSEIKSQAHKWLMRKYEPQTSFEVLLYHHPLVIAEVKWTLCAEGPKVSTQAFYFSNEEDEIKIDNLVVVVNSADGNIFGPESDELEAEGFFGDISDFF